MSPRSRALRHPEGGTRSRRWAYARGPAGRDRHTEGQRLAAVVNDTGAVDRAKVEALLSRHPRTLTLAELVAMHVVFFEILYSDDNPLAEVTYTSEWLDAFIKVIGGTITREKLRHSNLVERSVRRYGGREDVRRLRAEPQTVAVIKPRTTARESHRGRPGHRRARATRAGPDSDEPEPPGASWRFREVLAAEIRWRLFCALGVCG